MNTRLCKTIATVEISQKTLMNLDLIRLCREFFIQGNLISDDGIASFFTKYLTRDAGEIKRRNEILGQLRMNKDSMQLIDAINKKNEQLFHSLSVLNHPTRLLMYCSHMRYALEGYINTVNCMERLFTPETSPAFIEIAGFIRRQKDSSVFHEIQDGLLQAGKILMPLDNITLAVNMSESGQAVQIGVTGINSGFSVLTGIFDNSQEINSLCSAAPVKLRGSLSYLEEYIISEVEKQWVAPLNAVKRIYAKIDLEKLRNWCTWLESMDLYHKGLLFWDKLEIAGCIVCQPEPCPDEVSAYGMYYPHLSLTAPIPVPQSFGFSLSDTVIITGANGSGKTSALKSFTQNCVLAQLGFWIPAKVFRFIPYRQWYTIFSAGEDKQMRASRYQQEAEMMRHCLEIANPDVCLLFNEPFTSTNPLEAAGLLCNIITKLHRKNVTLIIVTHIFDVYQSLKQESGIAMRSYVAGKQQEANRLNHTYSLEEKEPDGLSYARLLAQKYGFSLSELLEDAAEIDALEVFMTECAVHA